MYFQNLEQTVLNFNHMITTVYKWILASKQVNSNYKLGAIRKIRHARGREGPTVCDREGGSRACDVTLIKKIIIHVRPEI